MAKEYERNNFGLGACLLVALYHIALALMYLYLVIQLYFLEDRLVPDRLKPMIEIFRQYKPASILVLSGYAVLAAFMIALLLMPTLGLSSKRIWVGGLMVATGLVLVLGPLVYMRAITDPLAICAYVAAALNVVLLAAIAAGKRLPLLRKALPFKIKEPEVFEFIKRSRLSVFANP